jgi:hypothetical protein
MPFTTKAYAAAMALTVAPLTLQAVLDQTGRVNGTGHVIDENNILLGGMAILGAAIAGNFARFSSPSLRELNNEYITPINTGLLAPDPHFHSVDNYNTRALEKNEQLDAEAGGAIVAIGQKAILVWLADQEIKEVWGKIIHARVNVTIAQAVNAWTQGTMTFIEPLPVGAWDVVGFDLVMAGGIAARLLFNNQTARPGIPVRQLPTSGRGINCFRNGHMGVWGSFSDLNFPSIECIGSVAAGSATYEGTIDLIAK